MRTSAEKRWLLWKRPDRFKVLARKAAYAVVMVMAADSDLVDQVKGDLEELAAGVGESVSALVLIDLPGDSGAAVLEVTPTTNRILARLPEISTGDPRPLAAFFARALVSYSPHTRFALGFWGHGKGVFADNDPHEVLLPAALLREALPRRSRRRRQRDGGVSAMGMLPDATSNDILTNREARSALGTAFLRAGRKTPVDIIFSDTCLNGSVEVFTELREFTQAVVASSLLIPAGGWNYKYWLSLTSSKMPADAKEWAQLAVDAYERAYPQVDGLPGAQLAAVSTEGDDIVKAFAKVVAALSEMKEQRRTLLALAANRVQSVQYRENLDLEQLVYELRRLAGDDGPLGQACTNFLRTFSRAVIGISAPPENGEFLSGLTIWCPIMGDREGVSSRYSRLEFAKKTKWMKLLKDIEEDKTAARP